MGEELYGGIEAGGTKFICAVGRGPQAIEAEIRIPTTAPPETIQQACDFFAPYLGRLRGVGLASFGPLDLDPNSPAFGYITTTPKPNWAHTNILGMIQQKMNLPLVVDMDVAAAGLGESRWGAAQELDAMLYLTVGTGIGGSYIMNGKPLRGLVSSEMGHIRIPRDLELYSFQGACPYHGDCFEGIASGPAIQARSGRSAESLADEDPFWELEAGYIAHALANYIFTLAPERIIMGGGIMQREFLFDKIRTRVKTLLNGYLSHPIFIKGMDEYILPPALGDRAGVLGAIALVMDSVQ